jgi:hypothetical protein
MNNKAFKLAIISGIISSVIVTIFIHPILSLLWNAFIAVAGSIHQGYVDRIYRNAALSDRNLIGLVTILFLLMAILLMLSLAGSSIKGLSQGMHLQLRALNTLILLSVPVILLVALLPLSLALGVTEISASFTQRLTVLAPAIDEREYKAFRARWASMKGLNDYNNLVSAMDVRAKELGITLPPVRTP